MQLYFSAGLIFAIVLWGVIAPASLGGLFDMLLAVITRDFGWLYLWVVLGTTLGMMLANAPVVWLGERITRRVPLRVVHGVSAVLFVVLGLLAIFAPD